MGERIDKGSRCIKKFGVDPFFLFTYCNSVLECDHHNECGGGGISGGGGAVAVGCECGGGELYAGGDGGGRGEEGDAAGGIFGGASVGGV